MLGAASAQKGTADIAALHLSNSELADLAGFAAEIISERVQPEFHVSCLPAVAVLLAASIQQVQK